MTDHLELTAHRTKAEFDQQVRVTYLGQAHFAGTGPAGTTCRQCRFWHLSDADGEPQPPYYSGETGELHKARCNRPMMNKAHRRVPHDAPSCRLFEASDNPKPAKKPDAPVA